ncbi:MAG TPA: DUF885 domain-containing protein [Pseudonocardiaceae bacterium]|nr:DUF885 domain-containing protein [Pseudonocardiaceae bacterium]
MRASPTLPELLDECVTWYFENHPIAASAAGADGFDDRLGDFSAAGFQRRESDRDGWLTRFESVPDDGLGPDDLINRDLLISHLRGERVMADWQAWRRDPTVYVSPVFNALHLPFLHRMRPEPELVAAASARLAQIPAVFAACRANLDPTLASPLLVGRALGQAGAGRRFVTETLPAEVTDEAHRARLAAAAEPAAEAFDGLVAFLTEFAERAYGGWQLGESLYSRLLCERELLGFGTEELHRLGRLEWDSLHGELTDLTGRMTGGSAGDWRQVAQRLADDHAPDLEAMRAEYDGHTQRARGFLAERGLVSFAEGESCRVVPSPAFQRPLFAVAFYIAAPPLKSSRLGHFFAPYTPDGSPADVVRQRLRSNFRAQMPTTAVHEAYPGHHWHLSWMAGSPHIVRKLFRTSYFSEGWALYTEKMMREQGFFSEPEHELAHLQARIFRAARIVVDTALHAGEMTIEQAEQFMVDKGALNQATAETEVNRYCSWPTQAPSYLTGSLQIERMCADYLAAGRGDLRSFHDTLAGSGSLPLGLARRAVLEE